MPKLKPYQDHQQKVVPEPQKPIPSGVACSDFVVEEGLVEEKYRDKKGKLKFRKAKGMVKTKKPCSGEMMIWQPEVDHPELPLKRASCGKCGWLGWV